MQTIYIDVMKRGYFYKQLEFKYCPLWPLNLNEVQEFVLKELPSLKNCEYTIEFSNQQTI